MTKPHDSILVGIWINRSILTNLLKISSLYLRISSVVVLAFVIRTKLPLALIDKPEIAFSGLFIFAFRRLFILSLKVFGDCVGIVVVILGIISLLWLIGIFGVVGDPALLGWLSTFFALVLFRLAACVYVGVDFGVGVVVGLAVKLKVDVGTGVGVG